ncbi:F-box protein pof6 [Pseudocercospora fuligena]|uniref:F-box protein pof6 n=1 Tax=Pseudocercospora fuligena TaxID=685502 RepID=A0A8H6VLS5_9PEZI|nr:F-box protein pof6 [Pseudocercospora fuligena]
MSGRSTPAHSKHIRNALHLEHLKKVQINGGPARSNENVFASLRATSMVTSKPLLPAELIATILDYLPVDDLLRFARVSHRLQEMVYDDTRWIQKLRSMGAWNEAEARQRVEEAMKRKTEAQLAKQNSNQQGVNGTTAVRRHAGSVTLFDAGVEEEKAQKSLDTPQKLPPRRKGTLADGFDELTVSGSPSSPIKGFDQLDTQAALQVFKRARSVRGFARQEFGKIYGALGPIYFDLAKSRGHADALIFRTYRDPEQQAQILSNLKRFSQCDLSAGWEQREERLDSMIGVFGNAVLREFDQGYIAGDAEGRMHRYANVLVTLNGGSTAIDAFISNHPLMTRAMRLPKASDCLEGCAPGHVDLNSSQRFFEQLANVLVRQAEIIDQVFPPSLDVFTTFFNRVCEQIISDYLTALFDEAHSKDLETYVKAVAGTLAQAFRLVASLKPTKASPPDFLDKAKKTITQCFDKHVGLYLAEEFEVFRSKAEAGVSQWEKELSEQEASTEAFFMSNLNRQAAKRDFLSSFKKVVMMPVNVIGAPFASAKPADSVVSRSSANLNAVDTSYTGGRPGTPTAETSPNRPSTPAQEAPTTELAAKTAILNSRLEGIKSLFSIEVALDLTHLAKASIERASLMVQMGGEDGEEAKKRCNAIFTTMLDILGNRHIKNGFDKAVGHLGQYNPREVRKFKQDQQGSETQAASHSAHVGVEPLVTFLELVNVGDLIQQMVDVFYSQELVGTKLLDSDDFLNPAVKDKKKFEQMLDERVAAGLNKGIDVLMDEVEYICATTQTPTDFNPGSQGVVDIGPSATAKQIVDMVSGHTGMLVGSTDKNMLDVFNQEVGLRLFTALCKHFKRQRISVDGAIKLISDINHYHSYVSTLRQKTLMPYYEALREMSQIYLVYIDPPASYFGGPKNKRASLLSTKESITAKQAKELATIIADSQRYHGIFPTEEVYEFAERRADWYLVKAYVESAMYGVGCSIM